MGRCALEKFEIAGLTVEFETGDDCSLSAADRISQVTIKKPT